MPTYNSTSKGQVDMAGMNPGHLINALNKQAKEAALSDGPAPEQLTLIGELAVTLIQKGFLLQVIVPRPE